VSTTLWYIKLPLGFKRLRICTKAVVLIMSLSETLVRIFIRLLFLF